MSEAVEPHGVNGTKGTAAQAAVPSSLVQLACGHWAPDRDPVVILPVRKLRFDCPSGCGLQSAA